MKNNFVRLLAVFVLLIYLAMQLLCVLPNDNKRQIVFLLWLACSYVTYAPIIKKALALNKNYLLYFFLIFIGISMLYRHSLVYSISFMISFCELFSPFVMYRILRTETKFMRRVVYTAITIILISNFVTCMTYVLTSFTNHGLRDAEFLSELKNTFFTVYAFAIFVPFIVFHWNKEGKKHHVFLGYFLCAVLAYFVIKSQYMTAIVLMVVGIVFALLYDRRGTKIILPVSIVLMWFLFLNYSDDLIQIAYDNNATATALRLEELQNILMNNASEAQDFSGRQNLSQSSLQTFIENPIVGIFYKYVNINEAMKYGIGNHAEWFDTLAKYGLFGFFLLIFVVQVVLRQKKVVGTSIHYILFIVLGFLNPVLSYYMTCIVFLYLPLFNDIQFFDERVV